LSPKKTASIKPRISACHVLIACAAAGAITAFNLVATVVVQYGHWPRLVFTLSADFAVLAWIGTFVLFATRHVTRYIHRCEKLRERRLEKLESLMYRSSLVGEAEFYLRSGET